MPKQIILPQRSNEGKSSGDLFFELASNNSPLQRGYGLGILESVGPVERVNSSSIAIMEGSVIVVA